MSEQVKMVDALIENMAAVGFTGIPEEQWEMCRLLLSDLSPSFESFEFQVWGDCYAAVNVVLNFAFIRIKNLEYAAKRFEKTKFGEVRKGYGGNYVANDEVLGVVMSSDEAQVLADKILKFEMLKQSAWVLKELLQARRDFILETSKNRRVEAMMENR